jgi:hypothetical protein
MFKNNPLALQGLAQDSLQMPSGLIVPRHSAEALIKAQATEQAKSMNRDRQNKAQFFSKFALANSVVLGAREKPVGTPMFSLLYEAAEKSFVDAILIRARVDQMKRIWQLATTGKNKEVGYKVVHIRHDDPTYKGSKNDDERCREMEKLIGNPTPAEYMDLYPHHVRPHTGIKDFIAVETKAELIIDRKVMLRYKRRDGQGYAAFHWMPGETIKPVDESIRVWAKKNETEGKVTKDTVYKMSLATGFDIAQSAYVQIVDGMVVGAYSDEEISVHISNPSDRLNRFGYGISKLELSLDLTSTLLIGFSYNRELFKQDYPEAILTVAGDFDAEGLQAFKQQIMSDAGGIGQSWRLPVIPAGDVDNFKLESHKLRDTPREMMFSDLLRMTMMLKCAAYGAHASTLNLETDSGQGGGSLSSPDPATEIEFSKEMGLIPMLGDQCDFLTDSIIRPRYDDLRVIIVGMSPEDEKQAIDIRTSRVSKWMTRNEARAEEGNSPIGFFLTAEDYSKLKENDPKKELWEKNVYNYPADVPVPNYLNTFNMLAQPQDGEEDDQGQGQPIQKALRKSKGEPVKFLRIDLDDQL